MFWRSDISAEQGPYTVNLKRGDLVDQSRHNEDGSDRAVAFKLYQPVDLPDGYKCPLVVWSHGYGGSRDGAGFLARYIASYGYAVLHITHTGTDSSLWEGKPGHPWEILKSQHISRAVTLNRFRDVPFVLDAFPDCVRAHGGEELNAHIDLSKIGMSGHSFGALTTQVMAGQLTPDEDKNLISLRDDRILASITYSPVPGVSHLSAGKDEQDFPCIYNAIQTPILHMTGTDDSSPINGMPYNERLKIYDRSELAAKAILIKDSGDHMVYNGTRGALAANPLRDHHEEMIKIVSLAWWEMWLKGDQEAKSWLEHEGVNAYLGENNKWNFEF